jgi:hypothetical protein
MRITTKHATSLLAGGILAVVLTAASNVWAAAPAAEESIRGLGQPVSQTGTTPTTQATNTSQEPATAGEEGGSDTDRWHHGYHGYHGYYGRTFYYYRPAPCYYYYYYPVVRYRPYVVIFDGADKTTGGAKDTVSDKVTDSLNK